MSSSCNGYPLVTAVISESLLGVWTADIEVDATEELSGTITLDIEGETFTGAVWNGRSAIDAGRWIARIAAGAAGMGTTVDAKNYVGVNVRGAIDDIVRTAGETLDVSASDSTTLATELGRYQRMRVTAGSALSTLAGDVGSSWRMLRSGKLKVAIEGFAELDFGNDDAEVIDELPVNNARVYAPHSPIIYPGVSIDGSHVEYVLTQLSPGALRQTVFFDA